MFKFNSSGQRVTMSAQINTDNSQMIKNNLSFGVATEPVFSPDPENMAPINIFHEQDPLYYKSFDPVAVDQAVNLNDQNATSKNIAGNITVNME